MENPQQSGSSASGKAGAAQAPAPASSQTEEPDTRSTPQPASASLGEAETDASGQAQPHSDAPQAQQDAQAEAEWTDEGGTPAPLPEDETAARPVDPAEREDSEDAGEESDLDPRDVTIADLREQLERTQEDLARARADHFNLNNQYSAYVRRQKGEAPRQRQAGERRVVEALLSVLDDIQAARDHGDLTGPFAAIAKKLEGALESGFKLQRYGAAGEAFDPNLHDALMAQTSADVDAPTIAQVIQPGYRLDQQILRPTKVMVNNPD